LDIVFVLQVVAGTNYAFEFGITYKCTTASNVATSGLLTLNSLVYQPLPASQNSNPQVIKYTISGRTSPYNVARFTCTLKYFSSPVISYALS